MHIFEAFGLNNFALPCPVLVSALATTTAKVENIGLNDFEVRHHQNSVEAVSALEGLSHLYIYDKGLKITSLTLFPNICEREFNIIDGIATASQWNTLNSIGEIYEYFSIHIINDITTGKWIKFRYHQRRLDEHNVPTNALKHALKRSHAANDCPGGQQNPAYRDSLKRANESLSHLSADFLRMYGVFLPITKPLDEKICRKLEDIIRTLEKENTNLGEYEIRYNPQGTVLHSWQGRKGFVFTEIFRKTLDVLLTTEKSEQIIRTVLSGGGQNLCKLNATEVSPNSPFIIDDDDTSGYATYYIYEDFSIFKLLDQYSKAVIHASIRIKAIAEDIDKGNINYYSFI